MKKAPQSVRHGTLASADLEKLSQAMASGMYPAFFIAMAFNCMEGDDDGGGGAHVRCAVVGILIVG